MTDTNSAGDTTPLTGPDTVPPVPPAPFPLADGQHPTLPYPPQPIAGGPIPTGYPPTTGYAPPAAGYTAPAPAQPATPYAEPYPMRGSAYAPSAPYGVVTPAPTNSLALASMICGLLGLVGGVLLAAAIIPGVLSIVAIVLGHIAQRQITRAPGTAGRGMALTGLITGYVGIALSLLLLIVAIVALVTFGALFVPFFAA